jgi:anti-anti-sigma regulatory factor
MLAKPICSKDRSSFRCPVCGNALPLLIAPAPFDAPCSECGSYLWCRRRNDGDVVLLEAIAGRSPEPMEVERVVRSLVSGGVPSCVILDLSRLELINSSFMARLIMMNRRIREEGGTFKLKGLQPVVREIFDRARLGLVLEVVEDESVGTGSRF